MIDELHRLYNIENIKSVKFFIKNGNVEQCFIQEKNSNELKISNSNTNTFKKLFLDKYPNNKSFGWQVSCDLSIIYSFDKGFYEPLEFKILTDEKVIYLKDSQSFLKSLALKESYSEIDKKLQHPEYFYKSLEKIIDISLKLKIFQIYEFSRKSNHDLLLIDPDIELMFKAISSNYKGSFYIVRNNSHAILNAFIPIFYFSLEK